MKVEVLNGLPMVPTCRTLVAAILFSGVFFNSALGQEMHSLFGGKLQVVVPDDYRQFVPSENIDVDDTEPLEIWFARKGTDLTGDKYPYFTIKMVTLEFSKEPPDFAALDEDSGLKMVLPEGMTPREIHDGLCESYTHIWSVFPESRGRIFDVYDVKTGVGRCVNAAGYQTIFSRQVGEALVIIETANPSEFSMVHSKLQQLKDPFAKLQTAEKWEFVKRATNAEIAEQVLLSARLLP